MNQPIKSPDAFLQGQRDCQAGIPHESGKGADYDRGYACQYERDQVATELSRRGYGLKSTLKTA